MLIVPSSFTKSYTHLCLQFDFDGVVDPELHQKREKANVKKGQRRQRKPSVARLAKEHASRQVSDSL